MKLSELVEKTGLEAINQIKERPIEGVYISDMVSDIISGAKANSILVTLQTHKSLIAAANLVDVAVIVFVRGKKPASDVIDLATRAGIGLFTTKIDSWAFAKKLTDLGFK